MCPARLGELACTRQVHADGGHWFVACDVPDAHDDEAE